MQRPLLAYELQILPHQVPFSILPQHRVIDTEVPGVLKQDNEIGVTVAAQILKHG